VFNAFTQAWYLHSNQCDGSLPPSPTLFPHHSNTPSGPLPHTQGYRPVFVLTRCDILYQLRRDSLQTIHPFTHTGSPSLFPHHSNAHRSHLLLCRGGGSNTKFVGTVNDTGNARGKADPLPAAVSCLVAAAPSSVVWVKSEAGGSLGGWRTASSCACVWQKSGADASLPRGPGRTCKHTWCACVCWGGGAGGEGGWRACAVWEGGKAGGVHVGRRVGRS